MEPAGRLLVALDDYARPHTQALTDAIQSVAGTLAGQVDADACVRRVLAWAGTIVRDKAGTTPFATDDDLRTFRFRKRQDYADVMLAYAAMRYAEGARAGAVHAAVYAVSLAIESGKRDATRSWEIAMARLHIALADASALACAS